MFFVARPVATVMYCRLPRHIDTPTPTAAQESTMRRLVCLMLFAHSVHNIVATAPPTTPEPPTPHTTPEPPAAHTTPEPPTAPTTTAPAGHGSPTASPSGHASPTTSPAGHGSPTTTAPAGHASPTASPSTSAALSCAEVEKQWGDCTANTCQILMDSKKNYAACLQSCTDRFKQQCLMNTTSCTLVGEKCTAYDGCTTCSTCTQNQCYQLAGCTWTGANCTYEKTITPTCSEAEALAEAIKQCDMRHFCSWNKEANACRVICTGLSEATCTAYPSMCKWDTAGKACIQVAPTAACSAKDQHACEALHCTWDAAHSTCSSPAPAHGSGCTSHSGEAPCTGAGCKWDAHSSACTSSYAVVLNAPDTSHGATTGHSTVVDCLSLTKDACFKQPAACMWYDKVCVAACTTTVASGCDSLEACAYDHAGHTCQIDCPRYKVRSWCEVFPECIWTGKGMCIVSTPLAQEEVSPEYKNSPFGRFIESPVYDSTPQYKDSPEYFESPEYEQRKVWEATGWDNDSKDTVPKFGVLFAFILVLLGSLAAFTVCRLKRSEKKKAVQRHATDQSMVDLEPQYKLTSL
eukprot:TRINITY_DN19271_c0_g1_i1.p1 TRINITY_DN19271_c0_g1~~TRINITY_DN19271_c0_g1_i1.p1  ORF type:complete len:576 (+),score=81.00 TRINITY_DN19271_c0_g1_i1:2488-4215(+)